MNSNNKSVDKCTSVTNSLIPESSSSSETTSSSSSNWDKTDYSSFRSEKLTNHNEDELSLISGFSSSSSHQNERDRGGFQVDILSSEPEDFDESSHLFHMDILKNSLSDISMPSSRKIVSGKPKQPQNLSFSRDRVREIERHNQLLLQRIMTTKPTLTTKPKCTVPPVVCTPLNNNSRTTSAAVNRKKKQRQIDIDNQLLRKKLEKIERTRRNAW